MIYKTQLFYSFTLGETLVEIYKKYVYVVLAVTVIAMSGEALFPIEVAGKGPLAVALAVTFAVAFMFVFVLAIVMSTEYFLKYRYALLPLLIEMGILTVFFLGNETVALAGLILLAYTGSFPDKLVIGEEAQEAKDSLSH